MIKSVIDEYKSSSGLEINPSKPSAFFSRNAGGEVREAICEKLGATEDTRNWKYLGMSLLLVKRKKEVLNFVKDRL